MDITLELIGELLRQIQADQRDMRTRIDLLERRQERAASHDDLRDLARVLTDFIATELAKFSTRIEARLDQTERSVHERLDRLEQLTKTLQR